MEENVYAAPKSQVVNTEKLFELCVDGRFVVTRRDTDWGVRCYCCNEVASEAIKVKLTCQPKLPMIAFVVFLLAGGLLESLGFVKVNMHWLMPLWVILCFSCLVLGAILTKRIKLSVPLCGRCRRIRKCLACVLFLLIVVFVVLLFVAPSWAVLPFAVLIVVAIVSSVLHPRLQISKEQDGLFWVKGVSQVFRDNLPEFY